MLTKRKAAILNLIVGEYVTSATPVPSSSIAQRAELGVSPATVRNEMAELEGEGYILRRHVSGGGIPSNKGYRFYLETIPLDATLPAEEVERARNRFNEARKDPELGAKLAAELLSGLVGNVAAATPPKAAQSRIKRMELLAIQETVALLVVILQEARIRQRLLHLDSAVAPEHLAVLAGTLNARHAGATCEALAVPDLDAAPLERQVLHAIKEIMQEEDAGKAEEPYLSGLRHLLHQPEFTASARMRELVEVLEDRGFLKTALAHVLAGGSFRASIGDENDQGEFQECSVLVARYGAPGAVSGLVAVIGPTRMDYRRSLGSIHLVSSLMGEMVGEIE